MNPERPTGVYEAMTATLATHDPPTGPIPVIDGDAHDPEIDLRTDRGNAELGLVFEDFYRDAYPAIARALAVTLGEIDLAQEAADEAMVRAYAHWAKVSHYDNPAGWVYRVGLNWARSVTRRLRRKLPWHERTTTEMPIVEPALHAALHALDVDLRAVVVCRLLLDWSVEETATALDVPTGTIKSRLHRALAQLHLAVGDIR